MVPLAITGVTAALLLLGPATACNGSEAAAPRDGGGPGDGSIVESAADATDGSMADAPEPAEGGPAGFVFFSTSQVGGGTLGAVFDGTPVLESTCAVTTVYGACVVYTCEAGPDAGPSPGAGTLTFSAPSLDGGVTLDAGATGLYELALQGPLFAPGDTLTVAASGGAVPAFGPQGIPAPGVLTLTNPMPDGGAVAVTTSSDFSFAWMGGSEDSLAVLTASGVTSDGSVVVARCTYVAITGEGILPSAVLTPVRGLSQGTLGWGQTHVATFDAGSWSVTLLAEASGATPATFE
jgi:hypothetical protein